LHRKISRLQRFQKALPEDLADEKELLLRLDEDADLEAVVGLDTVVALFVEVVPPEDGFVVDELLAKEGLGPGELLEALAGC
jgi:hypothetical protein